MERNKRFVLMAHCVMNQNTVILGWERSPGPFSRVMLDLLKRHISIVQLPCPEITYLGYERPPMTYEEYDTPEYREHARKILYPTLLELKELKAHGAEPLCLIGIEDSPSCDSTTFQGVFMEELLKEVGEIPRLDIPENYAEGNTWPAWDEFIASLDESV